MSERPVPPGLLRAAFTLAVDAATVEVVEAWRQRGVPCVLLKGASFSEWLYEGKAAYGDADLLVPHSLVGRAEEVLRELGYEPRADPAGEPADHPARPWRRERDRATIDLHRTVPGLPWVSPERVWTSLAGRVEPLMVLGHQVGVLDLPARAMFVALHAAYRGGDDAKALEHLHRALQRVREDEWRDAAALADRLDALGGFLAGLRLCPEGVDLAGRLESSMAGDDEAGDAERDPRSPFRRFRRRRR